MGSEDIMPKSSEKDGANTGQKIWSLTLKYYSKQQHGLVSMHDAIINVP